MLDAGGFDWLRLVDNGVVLAAASRCPAARGPRLPPDPGRRLQGAAVARHMQARGYAPEDCIAVGDSREDMDAAGVVGTFWLVANALERDPSGR